MKPVIALDWTEHEYEPGWGASQRPDGTSLHLTNAHAAAFERKLSEHESYELYSRPASPKTIFIPDEVYARLEEAGGSGWATMHNYLKVGPGSLTPGLVPLEDLSHLTFESN